MYPSRPKARTAHIGSVRLARENPRLQWVRNLMRRVLHGTRHKTGSVRDA